MNDHGHKTTGYPRLHLLPGAVIVTDAAEVTIDWYTLQGRRIITFYSADGRFSMRTDRFGAAGSYIVRMHDPRHKEWCQLVTVAHE